MGRSLVKEIYKNTKKPSISIVSRNLTHENIHRFMKGCNKKQQETNIVHQYINQIHKLSKNIHRFMKEGKVYSCKQQRLLTYLCLKTVGYSKIRRQKEPKSKIQNPKGKNHDQKIVPSKNLYKKKISTALYKFLSSKILCCF